MEQSVQQNPTPNAAEPEVERLLNASLDEAEQIAEMVAAMLATLGIPMHTALSTLSFAITHVWSHSRMKLAEKYNFSSEEVIAWDDVVCGQLTKLIDTIRSPETRAKFEFAHAEAQLKGTTIPITEA